MNIFQPTDQVLLVEVLTLLRPFEEVQPVMQRLLARLAQEGVPGLVSMQFYKHGARAELSAIIVFSAAEPVLDHTRMISSWPDFREFASMIQLVDMRVHGQLTPAVEAWIRQFNGSLDNYEQYVAGFVRTR